MVWLSVKQKSLAVLSREFATLLSIPYPTLEHFGTSAGDFRLLFSRTDTAGAKEKHTLRLTFEQKSEATLLIASYINAIVRAEGIMCKAAHVHQLVWDIETEVRAPLWIT